MGRPILSPGKKLTGEKTDRYTGSDAQMRNHFFLPFLFAYTQKDIFASGSGICFHIVTSTRIIVAKITKQLDNPNSLDQDARKTANCMRITKAQTNLCISTG